MRSHHRRETAAAEGAADARQFVDAILMHGEVPRVSTGSLRRPMRAVRQVNERLNGSRAGARLQANAIGHREPPVDTEERVSIVPLIVKQPNSGREDEVSHQSYGRSGDTKYCRWFRPVIGGRRVICQIVFVVVRPAADGFPGSIRIVTVYPPATR